MFLAENIITLVKLHFKVIHATSNSLLRVSTKNSFEVSSLGTNWTYCFKVVSWGLLILLLGTQCFLNIDKVSLVTFDQMIYFCGAFTFHWFISIGYYHSLQRKCALLNAMLEFERNNVIQGDWHRAEDKNETKRVKHEVTLMAFTGLMFGTLFGAFFLQNPYFPGHPAVFLLNSLGGEWNYLHVIINTCTAALTVWLTTFIISNGALHYSLFIMTSCHCFLNYIKIAETRSDGYEIYQQLKILLQEYNNIHQSQMLIDVSVNSYLMIMSVNTVVKSISSGISMAQMGFLTLSFVDRSIFVKDAFGQLGKVNLEADRFLNTMRRRKQSKFEMKRWVACSALKAKMGGANHFDRMTAPVQFNFVLTQAASLLLL